MKIVIVIPAYNEARYIGRFLAKLLAEVSKDNIVVVDDGSSDKTGEIAANSGVTVLSHTDNLGKGAALKTGCEYAFKNNKADAVIIMDGDDQHEVTDLKLFERELKKNAQIVLGIRSLDANMPFIKLFGNKFISIMLNLILGGYMADIPSGFKAMTKKAYKHLDWQSSGYEVETEIAVKILRSQIKFVEVPISTIYHDKDYGFNLHDALKIICRLPFWIYAK